MKDLCRLIWSGFVGLLRSRSALAAENLVLRQQINVLRRTAPRRLSFNCLDRLVFVWLYRQLSGCSGRDRRSRLRTSSCVSRSTFCGGPHRGGFPSTALTAWYSSGSTDSCRAAPVEIGARG